MADEQDRSQKTEEPTQRRLDEAHRKGQVATSREVNHVFILGAALLLIGVFGGGVATRIGDLVLPFVADPHRFPTDTLGEVLAEAVLAVAGALLLPVALFVGAAIAAGLVQNGLVISTEPLAPKLERISPVAGSSACSPSGS